MGLYGKILLIAMPAFLLLVLFEKWYGWYRGKDTFRTMDMISGLSSGVTNVVKDVMGLSVTILTYSWMVNHLAVFHLQATWLMYVVVFFALDFQGYWVHRWAHEINLFWNKHAIHHSSEDYNLACALRQSISVFINLFTFFMLPAALLGVPVQVVAITAPLHLFAQFWYHTQHIDRMGFLEKIIVTPSHHRVHHAINPEYMDKNYSQILIIWDKWFGTFQEELAHVPPVYGITRPARTWNPIKINFQHLGVLMRDAWNTRNWWDKVRIWFMPTGWRPEDVKAQYDLPKIEDIYHYQKYEPTNSTALKTWAWVQFSVTMLLVFYYFGNLDRIGSPDIFWYGGFIFLSVYSFTETMDRNTAAFGYETLKNALGLLVILTTGDWYGLSGVWSGGQWFVAAWFVAATLVTAWFVWTDFRKDPQPQLHW